MMLNRKLRANANKIGFLVSQYPEHTLTDIVKLFEMPAIDINTAVWAAVEYGYIKLDKEAGTIAPAKTPTSWNFGQEVKSLENTLMFAFTCLAKEEQDIEEVYLSNWTQGYKTHDVLVAMKHLIATNQLAQYDLEDPYNKDDEKPSTYTFTTLYDNREQLWGAKQFKVNPATGENNTTPENAAPQNEE